jgi:hypothetical protein
MNGVRHTRREGAQLADKRLGSFIGPKANRKPSIKTYLFTRSFRRQLRPLSRDYHGSKSKT